MRGAEVKRECESPGVLIQLGLGSP
jgi:hypothetical protein